MERKKIELWTFQDARKKADEWYEEYNLLELMWTCGKYGRMLVCFSHMAMLFALIWMVFNITKG